MIFLFTDYGLAGPYIGQVETVLLEHAPNEKVINLMADAPRNNPKASAYLLASLIQHIPADSTLFCVVDPGVGSDEDKPVALKIDGRWYVGPDNGLFDIVARQAKAIEAFEINWKPVKLSKSFHGRDLYAPVCAKLAIGHDLAKSKFAWQGNRDWSDDLHEVIYIDHFGNCMTGIRGKTVPKQTIFKIGNKNISNAVTFADVKTGQAFWYVNSNGLVEIAVNKGDARQLFNLIIGFQISY
jgi:S-adenosylmethionine hydrolase